MSTDTSYTTQALGARAADPVRIRALLDLLLPRVEPGEIDIHFDLDHPMVKLLVPDGAHIDHDDLRRIGTGRIKDWTGTGTPAVRQARRDGRL